MEKHVEEIVKPIVGARLTVTPDRVTMKFPEGTDEEEKAKIRTFFLYVVEQLKDVTQSWRGNYNPWLDGTPYINMKTNEYKQKRSFTYPTQ